MQTTFALAGYLRQARRLADLSQRELAERAGVAFSVVSRIEAGRAVRPSLHTVGRLLAAAGLRLAVVDEHDTVVEPMSETCMRDQAGRHFPAHLDVRRWVRPGDWWYDRWRTTTRPGPTHTFDRSRWWRDEERRRAGRSGHDADGRHDMCEPRPPDWRAADVSRRYPWQRARRSGLH